MSMLRSALDELRAEDVRLASDGELEADLGELQRAACMLESERLRRIEEVRHRQTYHLDGHLSMASWLAERLGVAWAAAARDVRTARALQDMPRTREALASGEVSAAAVQQLAQAQEAAPKEFAAQEANLVEAARTLTAAQLGRVITYWRQAADSDAAMKHEEALRDRRRLHVSRTFLGMIRLDADLDPETGETVVAGLRAILDAQARSPEADDHRTPAQRRADAIGEVFRQWLDRTDRPQVGGELPHVTLSMDLEALEGRAGKRCELDHAGPIHPQTARRLACDASVSRIITGPRSEPLDVGRKTPVVPAPMRRAVVVRDRHCRFPGCDRPHAWCDAHHAVHWADGGPTALSNLVLLCRRHHRLVHAPGAFSVEMSEARPRFRRPDGTLVEGRAPP